MLRRNDRIGIEDVGCDVVCDDKSVVVGGDSHVAKQQRQMDCFQQRQVVAVIGRAMEGKPFCVSTATQRMSSKKQTGNKMKDDSISQTRAETGQPGRKESKQPRPPNTDQIRSDLQPEKKPSQKINQVTE